MKQRIYIYIYWRANNKKNCLKRNCNYRLLWQIKSSGHDSSLLRRKYIVIEKQNSIAK